MPIDLTLQKEELNPKLISPYPKFWWLGGGRFTDCMWTQQYDSWTKNMMHTEALLRFLLL